jgi:hypothetical protein
VEPLQQTAIKDGMEEHFLIVIPTPLAYFTEAIGEV